VLAASLLFASTVPATAAEWQLKPFVGVAFGGATTLLVDLDQQAGKPHLVVGGSAAVIGEIFGVEGDVAHVPGFLGDQQHLVLSSSVTTLTGNVIVAAPASKTRYTLRPYLVGGGGWLRVHAEDALNVFSETVNMRAVDVGGGATGFLTDVVGLNWDLRYFRGVGGQDEGRGLSLGAEQLSYWRLNMAVVIRY
jgi:hypothetical protein